MNQNLNPARDAQPGQSTQSAEDASIVPPVNVVEDATGITLRADLPGVSKDKLQIHVEADTLTIEGELTLDAPQGMEAMHAEVSLPRYRRVFTLSRDLDASKITAEFNHGVVRLRIPKADHAQPHKVRIELH